MAAVEVKGEEGTSGGCMRGVRKGGGMLYRDICGKEVCGRIGGYSAGLRGRSSADRGGGRSEW